MSSQSPYMRKKKTELITELKAAENVLLEKQEALLTCQDELARILSEKDSIERKHRELTNELKSLTHELETAKTGLETTTKKLKKNKEELEQNRRELASAQAKITRQKKARETVPTSSYSFRLDVYPRSEGTYQSRIEHLLSGERQPLDGLDLNTITEFIGNYFPLEVHKKSDSIASHPEIVLESEPNNRERLSSPSKKEEGNREQLEVLLDPAEKHSEVSESYLNIQIAPKNNINTQFTPIELEINIELPISSPLHSSALSSKISIYSKNLESGSSTLLGIMNKTFEKPGEASTHTLNAVGLPEGIYRLDAVSSFKNEEGNPLPVASIQEGAFIQITR